MNNPDGYTALDLVGYTDKGDYSASDTYVANDLVHYGGSIWCCLIDDTVGITPTEGVNWRFWVEDSQEGISDIVNMLGAKNLLKVSATTTTTNGVTFTVNSDGSISVNGTATAKAVLVLSRQDFGTAYISTAQGGTTSTSEYIISGLSRNNDLYLSYSAQTTNIVVQSGYTVDNVRIYPMIRPKNIEDATWQPYTKTNKELTSDIQTLTNNVSANATAIQTLSNEVAQNTSDIKELTDVAVQLKDGYIIEKSRQVLAVNTDGVKTHAQILNELATSLLAVVQALGDDEFIKINMLSIAGLGGVLMQQDSKFVKTTTSIGAYMGSSYASNSSVQIRQAFFSNTSSTYIVATFSSTTPTFTIYTNVVPASGANSSITYDVYKKIS